MPERNTASISNEVATGRRMNKRDGFIVLPYSTFSFGMASGLVCFIRICFIRSVFLRRTCRRYLNFGAVSQFIYTINHHCIFQIESLANSYRLAIGIAGFNWAQHDRIALIDNIYIVAILTML